MLIARARRTEKSHSAKLLPRQFSMTTKLDVVCQTYKMDHPPHLRSCFLVSPLLPPPFLRLQSLPGQQDISSTELKTSTCSLPGSLSSIIRILLHTAERLPSQEYNSPVLLILQPRLAQ